MVWTSVRFCLIFNLKLDYIIVMLKCNKEQIGFMQSHSQSVDFSIVYKKLIYSAVSTEYSRLGSNKY